MAQCLARSQTFPHWRFGDILSLSRNDRISSFYWIRGSKHCILTSFSYLNRYFLFLVFLRNCYLLVSFAFLGCAEIRFLIPFLIPLVLRVPHHTCTPIFLAHITCFLEARRSWEPGTRISTGFLSLFRLLPKISHANVRWAIANHTFSSHIISSNWHFLGWHKPPLSQCSKLRQGIPKGFPILWIKADCCLSDDSFWTIPQALFALVRVPVGSLHLVQFDSADLPCNKILCSGFLNGPLPFGMHLKVSPEWHHIFDWL